MTSPYNDKLKKEEERQPAWVDEDSDEEPSSQSEVPSKIPKWAECSSTRRPRVITVPRLIAKGSTETLQPSILKFKESTGFYKNKGILSHFTFNREHPLALACYKVGGMGHCVLFQVDGEHNHFIQTINFAKFPATHAAFIDLKRFVVVCDLYSTFHTYNLADGTQKMFFTQDRKKGAAKLTKVLVAPNGEKIVFLTDANLIFIYDAAAISHVSTLLLQFKVKDAAFHASSKELFAYCSNGFVYVYDMDKLTCSRKFYDDGCVEGTSIAVAPNSKYIACGSTSGIVNLYETSKMETESPQPIKAFKKLITPITSLAFNSTSEILFMNSSVALGASKMAHIRSLQVFKNYPNAHKAPQPIYAAEFSPRSAYLAIRRPKKVELIRLHHYSSY